MGIRGKEDMVHALKEATTLEGREGLPLMQL